MKMKISSFGDRAQILNNNLTPMDIIRQTVTQPGQEDPFFILDLGDIVQKVKMWKLKLPRVKPFYAVKCNDNEDVLEVLAALGTGFDCASKSEIQKVLDMNVDPSNIILANPCKPASHIRYAAVNGVPLMTFDNEAELHKVKALYPQSRLVLRIRYDDPGAQCALGIKFGVMPEEASALLETAKELDLDIVGVAFHVGSGCQNPSIFLEAIKAARDVFDEAEALGFSPTLLDIGGGYPGVRGKTLDDLAHYINLGLDRHFPQGCGVQIIAEPGRYMVASAFTLATMVLAKRDPTASDNSTMYYINDGVYGSFNCVLYDHQGVHPTLLKDDGEQCHPSSIWGPTCDGLDQVCNEVGLPKLQIGDWLAWENMGAYTLVGSCAFNGFPLPRIKVVLPYHTWLFLEEHLGTRMMNQGICNEDAELDGVAKTSLVPLSSSNPCGSTLRPLHRETSLVEDQMTQLTLIDVVEM
ncbi:ornithine decarboxylase-like isoform X2 [Oratosquilla oratoria]|uniref:ornithine decarboxylase-like isoform X2 n=1 Tax=Oratosquilla oratoria TaxID=337810 RepID=UPI003F76262B